MNSIEIILSHLHPSQTSRRSVLIWSADYLRQLELYNHLS